MKKAIMAMIAIECLIVVSLSTFALSCMQVAESVRIKNEKKAVNTNTQSADSANLQTFNSDIQQASKSDVTRNTDKVDDSCKIQDKQTLSKHEFIVWPTETDQSPISALPLPLPDGRIFLRLCAGAEDPIPYIPTESPKTASRTPIVPPELDI